MASEEALQFCLMAKVLFALPLRQPTGMVTNIFKFAELERRMPDVSPLCRRQGKITIQSRTATAFKPADRQRGGHGLWESEWLGASMGRMTVVSITNAAFGYGNRKRRHSGDGIYPEQPR